jgi:hypothetical protein
VPLSTPTLTSGLQLPTPKDTHEVTLLYDVEYHGVWVFLTSRDGSDSRHFFYDERIGGYEPGAGGFFPVSFDDEDIGPTTACRYLNRTVIGTRDGRLLCFSKTALDDMGDPIISKMAACLTRSDELDQDTRVHRMELIRGLASDCFDVKVYGGASPEAAYMGPNRKLLYSGRMCQHRKPFPIEQRSPAIVVQLSNDAAGASWMLDAGQIEYSLHPLIYSDRKPAVVPAVCCGPEVDTPVVPPTDPDGGPGAGTDPKPEPCTDCEDWMALNHTEEFAAVEVYRLSTGGNLNSLATLQAGLPEWIQDIVNADICGITSASDVVIRWANQLHTNTGTYTYDDFLAIVDPATIDPGFPFSGWIMFDCNDQVA